MVFESIPRTVIQIFALLEKGGVRSTLPHVNSLSSIVFITALICAADLSMGWDASEENRKAAPKLYGYHPSSILCDPHVHKVCVQSHDEGVDIHRDWPKRVPCLLFAVS